MPVKTVVLICGDRGRAEVVRRWMEVAGVDRFVWMATSTAAREAGVEGGFDLVVYYLTDGEGLGGVDEALWWASMACRQMPLVVLSDRYDATTALSLFRLGVTDYLAVEEHADQVATLLDRWLGPRSEGSLTTEPPERLIKRDDFLPPRRHAGTAAPHFRRR